MDLCVLNQAGDTLKWPILSPKLKTLNSVVYSTTSRTVREGLTPL